MPFCSAPAHKETAEVDDGGTIPQQMNRWLRRILLTCSLAQMLAAVGLTIRGMFALDAYASDCTLVINMWEGVGIQRNTIGFSYAKNLDSGLFSLQLDYSFSWEAMVPAIRKYPTDVSVWIPHWLPFIAGAAYPTAVWLRHRRRKKDVGFPVEVSANEPRVEASQARTSPR